MRISILVPDISSNAMARTCPIAQTLARNHEIEIIGFDHGEGFFEPYLDEFKFTSFQTGKTPISLFKNIYRAYSQISGDICYAFRPLIGSLGVGYLQKLLQGTPLILDVEDIIRYKRQNPPFYKRLYHATTNGFPTHGVYTEALEQFLNGVDEITTTSRYLQEQYGGTILPYGPDERKFNPQSVSPTQEISSQYQNCLTLGFVGTVRPHKGLSLLAKSISVVEGNVRLVIAGYDPQEEVPILNKLSNGAVDYYGPIAHEEVPSFLSAVDVVPIPQRSTEYTRAQVPNKLFEAMAMEKPIISTNVGDIPEILGDCGLIVPPDSMDGIVNAINELIENEQKREVLGECCRKRYINNYGRDALESTLEDILCNTVRD